MDSKISNIYCPPGCSCEICNRVYSLVGFDDGNEILENYLEVNNVYAVNSY